MNYRCLALLFSMTMLVNASSLASDALKSVYKNETSIVFEANDGQKTNAYEGFILVPENRGKSKSRMIKVHYVRFPAKTKSPGAPIVYLAGGPGGSGIATAKWRRFPLFIGLTEHADVIALDQRGTGRSSDLPKCQSQQKISLTQQISSQQTALKYQNAVTECVDFWQQNNIDVLGYTSVQNAWDLNDLRKHFMAPKISLWGISYGSHLALAAMSLFEQHIDKVIIASAEGLDQTVKLPDYTANYFARVQDVIDMHPTLKKQYTDINAMMQSVHSKLASAPIMLELLQKDESKLAFLFQKHHMQSLASMMIADPNQYLAMLLQMYQQVSQNNTEMLVKVLSRGMFSNEFIEFKLMSMAMDIASGITDARLRTVQQQSKNALLGDLLNFPMPLLNKSVKGLDLGDDFRVPETNNVPTLLFTGTLDGRTYIEGQKQAISHLQNARQILVEHAGHNLFTASPEVLKSMLTFLKNEPVVTEKITVAPSFIQHLSQ